MPVAKMRDVEAPGPWASSGITDAVARDLKFQILTAKEVAELLSTAHPQPAGFKIPYFDLDGRETAFFRVRFTEAPAGWRGTVGSPQRYAQRAGSINEAYLPPLLPVAWREVAENPKLGILITEGEKKAAAGCLAGYATVGLGGVDVWRAGRRGIDLLAPLDQINWEERPVTVLFDSDLVGKPQVLRAQLALAHALTMRGAVVSLGSLPPMADGGKQGLDDYLVAGGKLEDVIAEAAPYQAGEALWGLSSEVIFVRDPGMVIERETKQRLAVNQFLRANYANRFHEERSVLPDGSVKLKRVATAKAWMEWAHRSEARRILYEPGQPELTPEGWNTWPGWGCQPVKGDTAPWERLLDLIFGDDGEARRWFVQWCAYPLQHPGTKLYTSAVIWGTEHGTGKTLLAYSLMRIYGDNAVEIKNKHLRGSFNGWQQHKQFIYGDEVASDQDSMHKRIDGEWLKGLITQDKVLINQKYLPEYTLPDKMNYIFSSNRPDAIFLEDTDRRFFVQEVASHKANEQFYRECDKWLKGDGPSHLFHHLLQVSLTGFNPAAQALVTRSKLNMAYMGKTDLGAWVVGLRDDPESALAPLGARMAKECDLFAPEDFIRAYDPERLKNVSPITMAKELRRAGFQAANNGAPVRCKGGTRRLISLGRVKLWVTPAAMAEHYDGFKEIKKYAT